MGSGRQILYPGENQQSSQNNLITVFELSYYLLSYLSLILFLYTPLFQKRNELSSQNILITILELSYHSLIVLFSPLPCLRGETSYKHRTILLFSQNYPFPALLWVQGKISYHLLRTFLLQSPNCLITVLFRSSNRSALCQR